MASTPIQRRNRRARFSIAPRWLQLQADAEHLEREIGSARPGVFTEEERDRALEGLEAVWHGLTNHRPRLPPSGTPARARTE
jgi:hypothetical protein